MERGRLNRLVARQREKHGTKKEFGEKARIVSRKCKTKALLILRSASFDPVPSRVVFHRRSNQMEEFSVDGVAGQLTVTPTKVIIRRKGALALIGHGIKGDKEISIEQISSIQFKKAGMMFNGFIQFGFLGSQESKSGLLGATQDENTVFFNLKQQPEFLKAKELIEEYQQRLKASRHVGAAISPLDELEKLAYLRDKGIITEAEFEAKKKQLLGI